MRRKSQKGKASEIDQAIGRQICLERVLKGLGAARLAEELGCSMMQIRNYEIGNDRISAGNLLIVCDLLNITIEKFFSSIERPIVINGFDPAEALMIAKIFNAIDTPQTRKRVLSAAKSVKKHEKLSKVD